MSEYEGGDAGDGHSDKGVRWNEPSDGRMRERLNYSYMDGLRGIGAFAVYLFHYFSRL